MFNAQGTGRISTKLLLLPLLSAASSHQPRHFRPAHSPEVRDALQCALQRFVLRRNLRGHGENLNGTSRGHAMAALDGT